MNQREYEQKIMDALDNIMAIYQAQQEQAEQDGNWGNAAYFEGQKSAVWHVKRHLENYVMENPPLKQS